MCVSCQAHPLLLEKIVHKSKSRYVRLAIRQCLYTSNGGLIFTEEGFDIVQKGDAYWLTVGAHMNSYCSKREIVDGKIQWLIQDHTNRDHLELGKDLVPLGDALLEKFHKLKVFL
jgi:hypothetical protein